MHAICTQTTLGTDCGGSCKVDTFCLAILSVWYWICPYIIVKFIHCSSPLCNQCSYSITSLFYRQYIKYLPKCIHFHSGVSHCWERWPCTLKKKRGSCEQEAVNSESMGQVSGVTKVRFQIWAITARKNEDRGSPFCENWMSSGKSMGWDWWNRWIHGGSTMMI